MATPWQQPTYINLLLSRSSLFRLVHNKMHTDVIFSRIHSDLTQRFNAVGAVLSTYDYGMLLALRYFVTQSVKKTGCVSPKHLNGLSDQKAAVSYVWLSRLFVRLNKHAYGRTDYQLAQASIQRLASVYCDIHYAAARFSGKLFSMLCTQRAGKQILCCFNPDFIDFFNKTPAIQVDIEQYCALPPGLARWLYGFWSTYAVIPLTDMRLLQAYSGSVEKRRANFRRRLCQGLHKLTEVDFIRSNWNISRNGTIFVERI